MAEAPPKASGSSAIQSVSTDCTTPLGIPCYTIQYSTSQWQFSKPVLHVQRTANGRVETIQQGALPDRFTRIVSHWTTAVRRDGSILYRTDDSWSFSLFGRPSFNAGPQASLYLAPTDQVVRIQHSDRTVSFRLPLIWHDRPFRRSKDGDKNCSSGILHFGTDFQYAGDTIIAGIPVSKWVRGSFWAKLHEEVYLASSLDCTCLKASKLFRNAWHLPTVVNSMVVSSVRLGEPDPKLFEIPAGFRQVQDSSEQRLRDFMARQAQFERK